MTSDQPTSQKKNLKNERERERERERYRNQSKNSDDESSDSGQEQESELVGKPSPVDDAKNKQTEKSCLNSVSESEGEPEKKAKPKAKKCKNKLKKVSKKNRVSSTESLAQPQRQSTRHSVRIAAAKLGNNRSRSALAQEDTTNMKWSDTNLETTLLTTDMRQLLENRRQSRFFGRKQDMIDQLKKCKVRLSGDLHKYTMKQLRVECKLRNILCELRDRKDIIIARLRGDIEAPPQKRPKVRGRKKSKQPKNLVYVVIYLPLEELSEDDSKQDPKTNGNDTDKGDFNSERIVLGVYKSEKLAYEKGCKQMLSDLKYKATNKRYNKALNEIRDLNDKESLAYLVETLAQLYKNNEEPYVTVHCSRLQG